MADLGEYWSVVLPDVPTLNDLFVALGVPGNEGKAFAIVPYHYPELLSNGQLDLTKLPVPDYEHHIYADTITDNYIVVRGPEKAVTSQWRLVR